MPISVSLKELVSSGAHFGHQSRRWNPKMKPYIYGEKEGVHIFDLTKTKVLLEEALDILKSAAKSGSSILLVGTKKQAKEKIAEVANAAGIFYVNERWLGGTLTNFEQMKRSTQKLAELKKGLEQGEFKDRTKKERLLLQREIERLERFFGGVAAMNKMPDVVVILDIKKENTAVREAKQKGLTTIGIVDTNSDPGAVDYPIPMNDDASRAIDYVLDLIGKAVMEGKSKFKSKEPEKE